MKDRDSITASYQLDDYSLTEKV